MTKQLRSRDMLDTDIDTYKGWVGYQFTPEMKWSNIEIDYVQPFFLFAVCNTDEIKEAFMWINT